VVIKPLALALVLGLAPGARAEEASAPPVLQLLQPAPPLPFRYVGRLLQNGRSEVLLLRGGVLHSIAEGDEIDGEYRVERITGAAIQFTYLPGSVTQRLDLAAASR
jgi:hypothetical protein